MRTLPTEIRGLHCRLLKTESIRATLNYKKIETQFLTKNGLHFLLIGLGYMRVLRYCTLEAVFASLGCQQILLCINRCPTATSVSIMCM